jgi:hypothetical protein
LGFRSSLIGELTQSEIDYPADPVFSDAYRIFDLSTSQRLLDRAEQMQRGLDFKEPALDVRDGSKACIRG